ncbi:hypothetical protein CASFOL_014453 [Castilleja foliolosa]|uniref:ATP synthase F0 subunit 8 n=1 Tax=Castilleja foliolosa TaxID=1961234 RepID=A0ABD3DNH5_9LAMI
MDLLVMTLFLGLVLAMFMLIPRLRKSDHVKPVKSNISNKASDAYTKAEVSLHNKRTDCWIIIKEKVG